MMSVTARSGLLAQYLSASSQVVATQLRPTVCLAAPLSSKITLAPRKENLTTESLKQLVPKCGNVRVSSGPHGPMQVRYAHTDIQYPDFSDYRRQPVSDPKTSSEPSSVSRRAFTYAMVGASGVVGAYAAKNIVQELLSTMSASADVLALAKVEVDLKTIAEGKSICVKWRGKPLFVRHRTGDEIETEKGVDVESLRHKEHDDERVKRPEWLILIGVCTHLGCVPIAHAGEYGGYFCPCHGSHYDTSGRIRKGPAPENLEVPEYTFSDDTTVVVG
ncbi:cytochrome b-c1 complex subunit Rieske, mitochondrial-like [Saccoglossus kowalevskii]|uniref:Cytochrome b-c1 complex subunit Rieske, mitochondrial n=1 Tax=Saccoglossus kowalevskii TaxID=10224 RepID=A0ABM0GW95_SACKO|nr:PREDICTED: cytochrome b-c1 complex subunit Rieske, mitochondrial-like [Saccoglossus kowalevskii]